MLKRGYLHRNWPEWYAGTGGKVYCLWYWAMALLLTTYALLMLVACLGLLWEQWQ